MFNVGSGWGRRTEELVILEQFRNIMNLWIFQLCITFIEIGVDRMQMGDLVHEPLFRGSLWFLPSAYVD